MRRIRALIDGRWYPALSMDDPILKKLRDHPSRYRHWITPDGAPMQAGQTARRAEPGRYHLYVSYACPWAHRTILYRKLKGLEGVVSMSVLHPRMASEQSWRFADPPCSTPDHRYGHRYLHEVYSRGDPTATTIVTVPMLWDRATQTIVNRESGDILRILEDAFDVWGDPSVRFRPRQHDEALERMKAFILDRVCTAVYRTGFAASQATYDREVDKLFAALDELELRLTRQTYLLGDEITEPDWHLFCTLVRFDVAYHGALRCSRRRLVDYPALSDYTQRLFTHPGVAETVDFEAIRLHYFDAHTEIDPTIVPAPPDVDFRNTAGLEARGNNRLERTPLEATAPP